MCVWAWVGTPTAAIASSTCRSMVARQWFRRGSGVVQVRLRHGSEVSMPTYCLSGVLQGWFQYGSDVVRACFRRGSGAAQVDVTRVGTPSATIVSFTCRSTVARLWFRRGSGAALTWSETQNANIMPFTRFSRLVALWFRCGSCVVQVWFRRGPGASGRVSEYQLRPSCLPRVIQWWLDYVSGVVQSWFRRGSGAARTWIGTCNASVMSCTRV